MPAEVGRIQREMEEEEKKNRKEMEEFEGRLRV